MEAGCGDHTVKIKLRTLLLGEWGGPGLRHNSGRGHGDLSRPFLLLGTTCPLALGSFSSSKLRHLVLVGPRSSRGHEFKSCPLKPFPGNSQIKTKDAEFIPPCW
jgi:hypothetical protein